MEKGYKRMITWNFDDKVDLGGLPYGLSPDEFELLSGDIQDAIDGVLEDWGMNARNNV
jgi:hypothetical protein